MNERKEPAWWALYLGVGLLGLVAASRIVTDWARYDNRHGTPRVHFYTPEAFANCAGMGHEAKLRGASHWTCHDPAQNSGE